MGDPTTGSPFFHPPHTASNLWEDNKDNKDNK